MLAYSKFIVQQFKKPLVRYSHPGGDHTRSIPFTFSTKYKITAKLMLFFGIGLAAPWLVVRHQMLKTFHTDKQDSANAK